MVNEVDFLNLYRQLGIKPDCSLDTFKLAYRRMVATLHPDRTPPAYAQTRLHRLQELNRQYEAALNFHRLHGRLPGTVVAARSAAAPAPAPMPRATAPRKRAPQPRRWRTPLATAGVLLLLWAIAVTPPRSHARHDANPVAGDAAPADAAAPTPMLEIGMSPDSVLAIEGQPVAMRGDLWEYGPSWVRFDHGALIDWYSSPLHALKVSQVRPSASRD